MSTSGYWQKLFISWGSIQMKVAINYSGRENRDENFKNAKAFNNYSHTVDEFYENLEI